MTPEIFIPPKRTLMGPGPSDVPPSVLEAMSRPLVGHLDPAFVNLMEEIKAMLREVFQTQNEMTFPVSGTGSAGSDDYERMGKDFARQIRDLGAEIEKIQPNMKALEQYKEVEGRLTTGKNELDVAKGASRAVAEEFEDVRHKRYELFTNMFEHVKGMMDRVYKDLTKSKKHPMGGNAYLALDAENDEVAVHGPALPETPSAQEVARHNLTHWPFRSWCPFCVSGKAMEGKHTTTKSKGSWTSSS